MRRRPKGWPLKRMPASCVQLGLSDQGKVESICCAASAVQQSQLEAAGRNPFPGAAFRAPPCLTSLPT